MELATKDSQIGSYMEVILGQVVRDFMCKAKPMQRSKVDGQLC